MAVTNPALAAPGIIAVHHNAADFDALIRANGMAARMRQARRCACYLPDFDAADPSCKLCHPFGFVWDDPFDTMVLATSRKPRRQIDDSGSAEQGDQPMSFLTGVIPTYYARVVLPTDRIIADDLLVKGETDTVRFSEILAVERADYVVRTPPVGEPYETENVPLRIEGIDTDPDIRLNGRTVEWIKNALPDGTRYVLRFATHPEYVVWEVQPRQEGGKQMPYRAVCKRIEFLQHPRAADAPGYQEPGS